MGGRTLRRHSGAAARGSHRSGALDELSQIAAKKLPISEERLFTLVDEFDTERSRQKNALQRTERYIFEAYRNFSPEQRVRFFSMLYDRFSEGYDEHMRETGHYRAIQRCLQYAMPYLRPPFLDLTSGTGEPLMYALGFVEDAKRLRGCSLDMLIPRACDAGNRLPRTAYANEISMLMRAKAESKLSGQDVEFSSHDALALPEGMEGRFGTVLCAQTFHLISDRDKARLVRSMQKALAPGGTAIVLEEDPFRITQSVYIDALSMFLRAVVRPIKPDILIGRFEVAGFDKLEDSASAPIDSEHAMRLHIFRHVTQV